MIYKKSWKYILYRDKSYYCKDLIYYRIKSLKTFGKVRKGDTGGYVQGYYNLSQKGKCWICDNAHVSGKAKVFENAWILDNARVFGNAKVSGNAVVSGLTSVFGNAEIFGHAQVFDNARVCDRAKVCNNAIVNEHVIVNGETYLV
jgi:serine acetyltransferase